MNRFMMNPKTFRFVTRLFSSSITPKQTPSNFEKWVLVWTKKYKNREEIPQYVSYEIITRSRSEARIKIATILMILTALGSVVAIISGKSAAKRGESVHQMNLDWHKSYNEEYDATQKNQEKGN